GTNNVYNMTVTATADFTPTLSTAQDLTITVTPVNDNTPVFINASPTFSLPENSAVGTTVGTVSATDADLPAQTLTYSIVSGNASGAFAIDPNTGVITVANSAPLSSGVFTLDIRVVDSVSPSRTADAIVVVNLTHVAQGPFIMIPHANGIFHMGRLPAFVSPDSTFTYGDVANPDYSHAKLTASIVTNRDTADHLSIVTKGPGTDLIAIKGNKVYFSGKQIGTFAGGQGNKHPDLVITFNSHATTAAVDSLMRRLNFHVQTHVGVTRTVDLQVTNIGGVDSNLATRAIAVVDIR
ncbi:MAG: protocadherin Fat 4-like, partial [Planctomycetaceae bacterium]|nr:protocadherin Fat 4-like [Planctomycetaceae bacterium]